MKDFESRLVGLEPYREKLCLREGATCAKPTSVQRLFDGTYEALVRVLPDATVRRCSRCAGSMQRAWLPVLPATLFTVSAPFPQGVLDTNGDNIFRADPDFLRIGEIVDTAYDANGNSDKPSLKNAGQPQLREMMLSVLGSGERDCAPRLVPLSSVAVLFVWTHARTAAPVSRRRTVQAL